jgi:hypothetical protein
MHVMFYSIANKHTREPVVQVVMSALPGDAMNVMTADSRQCPPQTALTTSIVPPRPPGQATSQGLECCCLLLKQQASCLDLLHLAQLP